MIKNYSKLLVKDLTAVLLGIALTFAFAPYNIFPLAVLAPAGLLALWVDATPKRALSLGFSFGLGFYGAGVYWVFISIHRFGDVPSPLAALITLGMISILALYPAVTGYILNRYFPEEQRKILYAFPALWVISEWVRSWLFTGFPWLFLGYSQSNTPLKGYAAILGVYGVSLAVVVSSSLLLNALRLMRQDRHHIAYLHLLTCLGIWVFGSALSLIPWTEATGKPISVSLVQANISQAIKWSPEHLQYSLNTYDQLTQPLWGKSKFIIWPESAVPLPLPDAQDYINQLDSAAQASHSTLILGIPTQGANGEYYNAIMTLGKKKLFYTKRHLVPFGEYTPFASLLSNLLRFMQIPMSDLQAGNAVQAPFLLDQVKILPFVCYEIGFPQLVNTQDSHVGAILTVTNDAWFGDSAAQDQHLQMAEMRALELSRPVLFVSNSGVTAVIGPDGNIDAAIPPHVQAVLTSTLQPMVGMTPWMRNGMEPLIFLLLWLLYTARRKERITNTTRAAGEPAKVPQRNET